MGKSALKEKIGNLREEIIGFVRFLDSFGFSPEELPEGQMRALAQANSFSEEYLEILNSKKVLSPKKLAEAEGHCCQLEEVTDKAKESIVDYILKNLAEPRQEQFKNYSAYAQAERAWYNYNNFIKKHGLEKFSRERVQALIDNAENPALLLPVLLSGLNSPKAEAIVDLQEAADVFTGLINHTPRSEFNSKTPHQKACQLQKNSLVQLRKQKSRLGFSKYNFDALFYKLGSKNKHEKKAGQKLLKQLWENYVDEKHGKIKTKDNIHHKNIVALWEQVKQRFYGANSADKKMNALKPFTKLRTTFVPSQFYPEVKELVMKGVFDESGTVRYRIVRVIEDVTFELSVSAPDKLRDLFEVIYNEREAYMRKYKLRRSRYAYPENIGDKVLRSLTQAQVVLEDQIMRSNAFKKNDSGVF